MKRNLDIKINQNLRSGHVMPVGPSRLEMLFEHLSEQDYEQANTKTCIQDRF